MMENAMNGHKRARRFLPLTFAVALVASCTTVPNPFTNAELAATASDREARIISAGQEPVSGPIDLYEAMARAIKYNLDHQVELKEEALRLAELGVTDFDMLPDLVANASFTGRDNAPGASSLSIESGTESLEPSRSTEREVLDTDLTLSWDILDFGVSYYRSKQGGDEVLIALEQRRAAINRVVEDVRTAYWRTVSAQRLLGRLGHLKGEAQAALRQSEALSDGGVADPLTALNYQRDLLTILRAIEELRRDLSVSRNQLAALMNLRQGQDFTVVIPSYDGRRPPIVNTSAEELSRLAFRNRPELREISYRLRINDRKRDVALLESFPSLRAFIGVNSSSNDFLVNNDWVSYGARASWNLLNIVRYPRRKRAVEAGETLLDARALALTQAVAAQVFVSKARVQSLRQELGTVAQLDAVNGRIARLVSAGAASDAEGSQERVKERMNAVLATLRHDETYADLQNAYANLYAAVGLDPYPANLTGQESVAVMADALRGLWAARGDANARR